MAARNRFFDVVFALALIAMIAIAWRLDCSGAVVVTPGGHELGGTCWVRSTTGIECPGCGTTRSMVAFFDGDFGQAMRWHPAGPVLAAASIIGLWLIVVALVRRRSVWGSAGFRVALTVIGFVHLGLGLARRFW